MDILLIHPEIPHNTGCAARLAAATGVALHLVEPLGFSLEDRYLKRAGLDYWPMVDLTVHSDWQAAATFLAAQSARPIEQRLRLFSARGGQALFDVAFEADDILCFGAESKGLPADLLERLPDQRVYVPVRKEVRSLNLANVVALGLYTAMVRAGVSMPDGDGTYVPHPERENDLFAADIAKQGGTS